MPLLRDVSDRVWDYISPRKTQKRRDKPFKVPALPVRSKLAEKNSPEITLKSKVEHWAPKTPASPSAVDKTLLPPSPPTSLHRYEEDFDGDTLVHDSVEDEYYYNDEEADAWDANDTTVVVDDGKYMEMRKPVNRTKEQMRQEIQCRELRQAGWSEDSVFMFQKLNLRGFEPLLPDPWKTDFVTLPLDLFTTNDSKAFIKADGQSDFRAQHALNQLFTVGGLARDAVLTKARKRTAERHIVQSVKKYSRWAMRDGGMRRTHKDLKLFDTVACPKDVPSYICEQKMIRKLHKLHQQWDDEMLSHDKTGLVAAPEELPTLYGVIASHTVMAFVSYVLPTEPNPMGSLRTIAIFDFGEEGYDVWNSLAIAIFVIHCRNRMQELKEFLPEPVVVHRRDPDL
ncbi:uncharacterized protein N0V89_007734 [Didymosphaeria variabile]|uniref:Uncharacterized protein n=1 Tax=Didymosphaeria variabile TaxID=1932322 RepID=A0A9W8XLE8_9PLEO|nr:uncharacterized protein N0V89_007734 [Didymosphaeria variabile]KAJ4352386.1 hypothetical protein N0V89_007734 [Didymosphaeria variabile]